MNSLSIIELFHASYALLLVEPRCIVLLPQHQSYTAFELLREASTTKQSNAIVISRPSSEQIYQVSILSNCVQGLG